MSEQMEVFLLGTMHDWGNSSRQDVRGILREVNPNLVFLAFCKTRLLQLRIHHCTVDNPDPDAIPKLICAVAERVADRVLRLHSLHEVSEIGKLSVDKAFGQNLITEHIWPILTDGHGDPPVQISEDKMGWKKMLEENLINGGLRSHRFIQDLLVEEYKKSLKKIPWKERIPSDMDVTIEECERLGIPFVLGGVDWQHMRYMISNLPMNARSGIYRERVVEMALNWHVEMDTNFAFRPTDKLLRRLDSLRMGSLNPERGPRDYFAAIVEHNREVDPEWTRIMIDERSEVCAKKLLKECSEGRVVGVVGGVLMDSIERNLAKAFLDAGK